MKNLSPHDRIVKIWAEINFQSQIGNEHEHRRKGGVMKAYLILEDGTVFTGTSIGSTREIISEIVFNTSMTGYLEVLTDPSYAGQAVVMTYPLIGNYGITPDMESARPWPDGYIVRELSRMPSNFRCQGSIQDFLTKHDIPGIAGIDTRALTKILREKGTMNGMITTNENYNLDEILPKLKEYTTGNVVDKVTCSEKNVLKGSGKKVALMDFGAKNNIAKSLNARGCEVTIYPEKEFVVQNIEGEFIFDMARDRATIERLKKLEDGGALVVNSAYGIDNCVRQQMTELLVANEVPHPRSFIISTDEKFTPSVFPCWIKRGNSHAMVKEDVVYVECREEAEVVMADFRKRNIPVAVVNEHLVGDLVKFYGVQGTDFFYTFYPTEQSHSKFGLEAINGATRGFPFDVKQLQAYANKAAEVLNVPVYGGDCVVSATGEIRIIDFNDWPSFARCREEAGPEIAKCIYNRIIHKLEK